MSLVDLSEVRAVADPDVVERLTEALEMAQAGKLVSVAIVGQRIGSATTTAYSFGTGDVAHLVCAIERLKLRLLDDAEEVQ